MSKATVEPSGETAAQMLVPSTAVANRVSALTGVAATASIGGARATAPVTAIAPPPSEKSRRRLRPF
jgi:hypothetical protein